MGFRVLVVDDEEDILEVLQDRLEAFGFEVVCARTGREALKKLAEEKLDGVFLDIKMPEMDGIEALERIRGNDKNIPVIMITASANREAAQKAESLGADEYVLKPFDWTNLKAKIEKVYEIRLS